MPEPRKQRATAGRCASCGKRVVRGLADGGGLVNVDIWQVTPAIEQLERARGRSSFVLGWKGMGMSLTARTDQDVLLLPAGFRSDVRVVLEHRCGEQP